MTPTTAQQDLRDWISETVAPEIQELLEDPGELRATHTEQANAAWLQWAATHFIPADPEVLHYADGGGGGSKEAAGGDGGMDIVQIDEVEGLTTFTVYQLSAPSLENMLDGKLPPIGNKLVDDAGKFRNVVHGKTNPKKMDLNPTAREVLYRIQKALEEAQAEGATQRVRLQVVPMTLRRVEQAHLTALEQLRKQAAEVWSNEHRNVEWAISEPLTSDRLFDLYLKTPSSVLPDTFSIRARGEIALSHPQHGPVLCFLLANDILDQYDKYKASLFDSNLRFYLAAR